MAHPSYIITCSCNSSTIINWDEHYKRYFAQNSEWFTTWPEGWHCGRLGHTQRVPPKAIEPPKHSQKLKVTV